MYCSIDIETTGLDSDYCQLIQFAAVLWVNDGPIEDQPFCDFIVRHDRYTGQPFALHLNAWIFDILAKNKDPRIIDHSELGLNFSHFLAAHDVDDVVVIGKNFGSFDLGFIKRLMPVKRLGHRFLDVGSVYASRAGIPSSSQMPPLKIAGAPHQALYDARWALEQVRLRFKSQENVVLQCPEL